MNTCLGLCFRVWGQRGGFQSPHLGAEAGGEDEDGHEGYLPQHRQHHRVPSTNSSFVRPSARLVPAQGSAQSHKCPSTVSTTESPSTKSSFVRPSARLVHAQGNAQS